MIRALVTVLCFTALCSAASGEEIRLYENPVSLKLFGEAVRVPLRVTAVKPVASDKSIRIRAQAEISTVLALAARKLVAAVAARTRDCKEHWSAWNESVSPNGRMLNVSLTIRVEIWVCKRVFGKRLKKRVARETATLYASARPRVEGGRLQLDLTSFRMDGLGRISRVLGVERLVRAALDAQISELNRNPAFHSLPPELSKLGFKYETVELANETSGRFLRVTIVGPNDFGVMLRVITELAKHAG